MRCTEGAARGSSAASRGPSRAAGHGQPECCSRPPRSQPNTYSSLLKPRERGTRRSCKTNLPGGSCPPAAAKHQPNAQSMATPRPTAPLDAARPGSSPAAQSIRSLTQLLEVRAGREEAAEAVPRTGEHPQRRSGVSRRCRRSAPHQPHPALRPCRMTGTRPWARP